MRYVRAVVKPLVYWANWLNGTTGRPRNTVTVTGLDPKDFRQVQAAMIR